MRFLNNRPLMVTIAIVMVLLVVMFVVPTGGRLTGPENLAGTVTGGVQGVFSGITSSIGNFFRNIFTTSDVERENMELRAQLAEMQQNVQRMQELEAENERLKGLLSYAQSNPSYEYLTASVVTKEPGYFFDVFVINAGHNDGVQKDDAVITADGLVGRVTETGGTWSRVMSIIDSRSSVSGTVERTRDNGVVNGSAQSTGTDGNCIMSFLPLEAELVPGDRVVSNGLGGVFPSGFVIGQVVEVSQQSSSTGKSVVIKPAVDFLHIEEVMVVKEKTQE